MAEFCKECFLKLFGPVDDDEEIIHNSYNILKMRFIIK